MSDKIVNVTTDTFESEVIESSVPVLVDFWGTHCAPCHAMSPILDQLAEEYDGRVKVVKINVEENMPVAQANGIRAMPTLQFFKGGQRVAQQAGAMQKPQLVGFIEGSLGS